jgi:hypothetical protein
MPGSAQESSNSLRYKFGAASKQCVPGITGDEQEPGHDADPWEESQSHCRGQAQVEQTERSWNYIAEYAVTPGQEEQNRAHHFEQNRASGEHFHRERELSQVQA